MGGSERTARRTDTDVEWPGESPWRLDHTCACSAGHVGVPSQAGERAAYWKPVLLAMGRTTGVRHRTATPPWSGGGGSRRWLPARRSRSWVRPLCVAGVHRKCPPWPARGDECAGREGDAGTYWPPRPPPRLPACSGTGRPWQPMPNSKAVGCHSWYGYGTSSPSGTKESTVARVLTVYDVVLVKLLRVS